MEVKVKYIYNIQAVPVKGADWMIHLRNQQRFDYLNARFNLKQLFEPSQEMQDAWRGNY